MKHTRLVAPHAANFTVSPNESGKVFFVEAADVVATLPGANDPGLHFTFFTTGGATGFSLSPAAEDAIHGNGLAAVADKDLINTTATAAEGDTVTVWSDGENGWWISSIVGTWDQEA